MARLFFVPDQRGIDEALNSPEMAALLTSLAELARAAAHARGANRRGGEIVVSPATPEGGSLSASFGSTSSFWHLEEFGSANNPPYRTLTNAALAAGLRFEAAR